MADFKDFYRDKNVLVTGGLGFIGSNLVIKLVGLGAEVTVVDSMIPAYGGNLFNIEPVKDKIKVNYSDVRDENSMNYLVQGQDCIFNLAGQVSHIDSMKDPYTDLEINCKSQLSILEACRKFNDQVKIIFAGTRGQYGKTGGGPVDEDHLMHPTDVNGINKLAGEWFHILYNNVYGIRACSLRLTNTFGPRHIMKNSRQGYLAWFIRQAIDNEDIKIFGDGQQKRDFTFVDDVAEAFLMAMASDKADGEIFNLGSGRGVSVLESAEKIVAAAESESKIEVVPFPEEKKKIEIGDYIADTSKIKAALGWQAKTSFEDGLKPTVDFYRQFKARYW